MSKEDRGREGRRCAGEEEGGGWRRKKKKRRGKKTANKHEIWGEDSEGCVCVGGGSWELRGRGGGAGRDGRDGGE